MKKIFLGLLLGYTMLFGENLLIKNYECDLYSKVGNNAIKKLNATLEIVGRDLQTSRSKILDSLNIIISSYFLEDILTSKGKENFKQMFISYATKRYNIDIEEIFIIEMKVINEPNIDEIIKAIRETGICGNTPKPQIRPNSPTSTQKIQIPKNTKIDLNGYDYTKDPNFGKDFGQ